MILSIKVVEVNSEAGNVGELESVKVPMMFLSISENCQLPSLSEISTKHTLKSEDPCVCVTVLDMI